MSLEIALETEFSVNHVTTRLVIDPRSTPERCRAVGRRLLREVVQVGMRAEVRDAVHSRHQDHRVPPDRPDTSTCLGTGTGNTSTSRK